MDSNSSLDCTSASDPALRLNLKGHAGPVTSIKFRNADELISGSTDSHLLKWHLNTADVRTFKFSQHIDAINDVDCTPNGKILVTASNDKTIRLWVPSLSVKGGVEEIRAHMKPVTSVHFSATGRRLLSGSTDKCLKLWDVQTRKFLHSMVGHNHYVNSARLSHDGKIAVSCSEDKSIKVWDVQNKQCVHTFSHSKASAKKVAIYGKFVACALETGTVRIYDYMERRMVQHYVLHKGAAVTDVAWHPSGKYLLASGNLGKTTIIDVLEGRPIYNLQGLGGASTSIAFSPNGETFACGGANKHILIWDWKLSAASGISVSSSTISGSSCY